LGGIYFKMFKLNKMSKMEFTKGEWYNPKFDTEIISMPSQIKIGRVYPVSMKDNKEMQANARLIAAAPKLLESLQSAIAFIKHNCAQPPIVTEQVAKWEQIVYNALNN
jgi:hypothetical protein